MNEKTKLLRNLIFLSLFFYLLSLISCNEDFEEIDGTHFGRKHGNNVKILTGNDAKLIFNELVNESKNNKNFDILGNQLKINVKNSFFQRNSHQTTIDYSQIMQVSDLKGNVNYTFKILNHPDDDEDTFHNLVYNNQDATNPRINLLKFDNVGANFRTTDNSTMTSNSLVAASDPCPPVTTPINNPVVGDPGGGDPGGGDPGGGNPIGGNPIGGNPGGGSNGENPNFIAQPISISFNCNSCNFSSNNWSSFSHHRDRNGNIYDFTLIIFRTSSSPNTIINSNPCDTQGDIGVLPNLDNKKPCNRVKNITNNTPNLKSKITNFKTPQVLNLNYEKGFNFVDNAQNQTQLVQNDGNANSTSISVITLIDGSMTGVVHSHFDRPDMLPTFTFEDLMTFNSIYQYRKYNQKSLDKLTLMVVTRAGVFAMMIENESMFDTNGYNLWTNQNAQLYNKFYENILGRQNLTDEDVIVEVTKGLASYGIGLYQANSDLSNWSKITVDANNNKVSTPCN